MAVDKDNNIRIEKRFALPLADVYAAFADEDFFDFCGADLDDGECDYRVGGKYSYVIDEDDFFNGEFKEIVPNERIAFTWVTKGLDGQATGDTLVRLDFLPEDKGTTVVLEHTGIKHRKTAKGHDEGWVEILEAIAEDLEQG